MNLQSLKLVSHESFVPSNVRPAQLNVSRHRLCEIHHTQHPALKNTDIFELEVDQILCGTKTLGRSTFCESPGVSEVETHVDQQLEELTSLTEVKLLQEFSQLLVV